MRLSSPVYLQLQSCPGVDGPVLTGVSYRLERTLVRTRSGASVMGGVAVWTHADVLRNGRLSIPEVFARTPTVGTHSYTDFRYELQVTLFASETERTAATVSPRENSCPTGASMTTGTFRATSNVSRTSGT